MLDAEAALMKLSDVIASTYFTTRERSERLGVARMIYDVRQTTIYHYASPVAYAHHVLRLTPIDRERQRVHAAALDITPTPIERREGQDFFGNRITWIALDQPHDTLTCGSRRASRSSGDAAEPATPAWEEVRAAAFACADLVAACAGALSVSEPAGVARSGDPRLCGR